jgi:hypothetical protein
MTSQPEFSLAASEAGLSAELLRAVAEIKKSYGHDVSVTKKSKSLAKFGRNPYVDSAGFQELWPVDARAPYRPSTNAIDTVTSTSGSDTETIRIEGHTISGNDLTFVIQTVTLTGQTEATLSTPLARVTRVANDQNGATALVGAIYVFEGTDGSASGVPTTLADVAAFLPAGDQQTQQAFTSISKDDYWLVIDFHLTVNKQQTAAVDGHLEVRRLENGIWLPTTVEVTADSAAGPNVHIELHPPLIIRPNSDIRWHVLGSSASDTEVSGFFSGYLAEII